MHLPDGSQAPPQEPDFSEFMWMAEEDLESFDNQVILEVEQNMQNQMMQQQVAPQAQQQHAYSHLQTQRWPSSTSNTASRGAVEEERFLQQMLEEEEARDTVYYPSDPLSVGRHGNVQEIEERLRRLDTSARQNGLQGNLNGQRAVKDFKFNPLAREFSPNPLAAPFVPREGGPNSQGAQGNPPSAS